MKSFKPWQIAAYLTDRADQYETRSPCWVALTDAVHDIMNGTAADRIGAGEVDDLRKRVEKWRNSERTHIDPSLGVERP